jgi:hypothetical protein
MPASCDCCVLSDRGLRGDYHSYSGFLYSVVCLSVIVKYIYKMLKTSYCPPAPYMTRDRVCPLSESALLSITISVSLQVQQGQNIIRLPFSFINPTNTHHMNTPVQPFVTPTCSCETVPFPCSLHTIIKN